MNQETTSPPRNENEISDSSNIDNEEGIEKTKVYVAGVNFSIDNATLTALVVPHLNNHVDVRVVYDVEASRHRGFAFVNCENQADAQTVIDVLNGKEYEGRTMAASFARIPTNGKFNGSLTRGNSNRGNSNRGGRISSFRRDVSPDVNHEISPSKVRDVRDARKHDSNSRDRDVFPRERNSRDRDTNHRDIECTCGARGNNHPPSYRNQRFDRYDRAERTSRPYGPKSDYLHPHDRISRDNDRIARDSERIARDSERIVRDSEGNEYIQIRRRSRDRYDD